VINTNLHPILHPFQVTAHYWSNFACNSRWPHFNTLTGGDPLRISIWSLSLQKLEWLCYLTVKTAWSYLYYSRQTTWTWRTDRQTEMPWLLCTALQCEQCAHAVMIIIYAIYKKKAAKRRQKWQQKSNLQFFNFFFKVGFMLLLNIGVSGVLHLQPDVNSTKCTKQEMHIWHATLVQDKNEVPDICYNVAYMKIIISSILQHQKWQTIGISRAHVHKKHPHKLGKNHALYS